MDERLNDIFRIKLMNAVSFKCFLFKFCIVASFVPQTDSWVRVSAGMFLELLSELRCHVRVRPPSSAHSVSFCYRRLHSVSHPATQRPDRPDSRLVELLLVPHSTTSPTTSIPFRDLLYVSVSRNKPICLPTDSWLHLSLFLLMAGDIESNPGPRRPKYPCGLCSAAVKRNDPAVCCD